MKPWGFALGALTGAAATFLLTREGKRVRPVAKAALKAAMMAYHEARTQGAELAEAAEDLFAEAKAEATTDIFTSMMAKAQRAAASPQAPKAGPAPSESPAAGDGA
jgi:hypothetical protein